MFDKYKDYRLEDFVNDDDFIRWVNIPDEPKDLFWTEFLMSYPEQSGTLQKARQVVCAMRDSTFVPHTLEMEDEIWESIKTSTEAQPVNQLSRPATAWLWRSVAAAVILAVFFAGWIKLGKETFPPPGPYFSLDEKSGDACKSVHNKGRETLSVTLPDSSIVRLSPNARLKFPLEFTGKQRQVAVSGEAFFDVRHYSNFPFVVYAGEVVTKVLGTSFVVNANSANVTVSVKTGQVSVYTIKDAQFTNPEARGLILKPNQQAAYNKASEVLAKSLVNAPEPILAKENRADFNFVNAPVSRVFDAIEATYGIEIVYDKETLEACRLYSSLGNEDLFEKLEIICEAIDASYKVIDARIIIQGKKCNHF